MKKIILKILVTFFFCYATYAEAANFNKVLVIVLENTDFNTAMKQPYLSALTKEGALLTNFQASVHPSQGNYIAMVAGSSFDVTNDKIINIDEKHIGDLIEDAKKDWKAYAEDYPGNCYLEKTSGNFARKHVPFLSFVNVQKNLARCLKVVEAKHFFSDFEAGKLPEFSMYIPNLKNDGHDTGVAFADKWLRANFDPILHSPKLPKDLLIVVTFDEGAGPRNQIYTLLYGANVNPGTKSSKPYNFYSLLRTYEDELGLGSLNTNDMSAQRIDDVWKR